MAPQVTCARSDCNNTASMIPQIRVWAKGYPKKYHAPIEMSIDLPHCEDCAAKTKLDDLVGEEQWSTITKVVHRTLGRLPPDRDSAELHWGGIGRSPFKKGGPFDKGQPK